MADSRIIKNLLGLMYIDQEKGWTLLNRGKVIGGIHFSIDELMAALNHTDCESLFEKRDLIENEISKYNAMLNMNSIKEEYYENNNNLEIVSMGEDIKKRIASLQIGDENTKLILNFLKKEFADNQVIIASIYSEKQLFVDFDAVFSFNNRAIESR